MRILAIALGTVIGGVFLSTLLFIGIVMGGVVLGADQSSAGTWLLMLPYPAGFALAGWLSYRAYGRPKPVVSNVHSRALQAAKIPAKGSALARWTPLIATLGFIGVAGAWLVFSEDSAKADAKAFCAKAVAGQPVAPVAAAAQGAGKRQLRRITAERVEVGFVGLPPFSRHLCTVEAENGVIRKATYGYLD